MIRKARPMDTRQAVGLPGRPVPEETLKLTGSDAANGSTMATLTVSLFRVKEPRHNSLQNKKMEREGVEPSTSALRSPSRITVPIDLIANNSAFGQYCQIWTRMSDNDTMHMTSEERVALDV